MLCKNIFFKTFAAKFFSLTTRKMKMWFCHLYSKLLCGLIFSAVSLASELFREDTFTWVGTTSLESSVFVAKEISLKSMTAVSCTNECRKFSGCHGIEFCKNRNGLCRLWNGPFDLHNANGTQARECNRFSKETTLTSGVMITGHAQSLTVAITSTDTMTTTDMMGGVNVTTTGATSPLRDITTQQHTTSIDNTTTQQQSTSIDHTTTVGESLTLSDVTANLTNTTSTVHHVALTETAAVVTTRHIDMTAVGSTSSEYSTTSDITTTSNSTGVTASLYGTTDYISTSTDSTSVDATSTHPTSTDATASSDSNAVDITSPTESTTVDSTPSIDSTTVDVTTSKDSITSTDSATVDATTSVDSTTVDAIISVDSTTVDVTTSTDSTTADATSLIDSTTVDTTTSLDSTTVDARTSLDSITTDAKTSTDTTTVSATTSTDSTTVDATTSTESTTVDAKTSTDSTTFDATTSLATIGDVTTDLTAAETTTPIETTTSYCQDCECWMTKGFTGALPIYFDGQQKEVSCVNSSTYSWTVFQRRFDGSESFNRLWVDYENGFGSVTGEFWLGNAYLHKLTMLGYTYLRIEVMTFDNVVHSIEYPDFQLGDASENYMLRSLGTAITKSADMGDSLSDGVSRAFSTSDRDNDDNKAQKNGNCALILKSGWWFNNCADANLNGEYSNTETVNQEMVYWFDGWGWYISMKETTMKIRKP